MDTMTQQLADNSAAPAPTALSSPPAEVLRTLLAGTTAGRAVGRGHSSEVHACQADPYYVIRTVRQQDEIEWQRELSRLRRVPALSVISTVYATNGPRALMPRLWPVPRAALRASEIIKLNFHITAALEMLHRARIVHADIHADNVMIRSDPACLIDYAGCTGDSVYPLHLDTYGASGYGGDTHRPPTLEPPSTSSSHCVWRLARTILKQLTLARSHRPSESKMSVTQLCRATWAENCPRGSNERPRSQPDNAFSARLMARFGEFPHHYSPCPALDGQWRMQV